MEKGRVDISGWLRGLGLEQYEQAFLDNAIDAEILPQLTTDDLKDMGVGVVGHRRKLLAAIAALAAGMESGPAPLTDLQLEGERRQVAVLFADMVGYTALEQEIGDESIHALLGRYFDRLDRAVESHGGRIDKHIGDCVMGVFGAPVAHGNDVERAVSAALAIRDAMPDLSTELGRPIQVHIGVAGGQVVASATGSASHREYTVTGETVNLASRLADAAGPGEILISEQIWRTLADRIDSIDAGALTVKGFAEPVVARQLRGFRAATGARRSPFVGRQREMANLTAALSACLATGRGQSVHLRGEAGIGKTRLVEEFRCTAEEAGFVPHTGLVLDFGAGLARDTIRTLLRDLAGVSTSDNTAGTDIVGCDASPEELVLTHDLLGLPIPEDLRALYDAIDVQARQRGRRRMLGTLVEISSRRRPRMLIIEDIHWADRSTLEDLSALAGIAQECRAIVMMTSRLEGDPLDAAWRASTGGAPLTTIDLGRLPDDAALELAGAFLSAPDQLARHCVERAAGNPLFLEQLLSHAEEMAGTGVPGSVKSLVQARIDRLDPADKQALQAASIIGQRFDLDALNHVLGRSDCRLEQLVKQLFVRPQGDGFLFSHALIRDAIYDTLLIHRRRALHKRAAEWFRERDAVIYAEHLDRGDDPGAPLAYLDAVRSQAGQHRLESALGLADRAFTLATRREDRFVLAHARGEILNQLGRMAEAAAAYQEAEAMAESPAERCRAALGLAAVKRVTDDLDGAGADLDRAEAAALQAGLMAERARVHYLRGNLLFPRGDIEGVLREHGLGLELARACGSVELEAAALGGLGDAEYMRGRIISARGHFQACVDLAISHGFGHVEVANRPMAAITRFYACDMRGMIADALAAIDAAKKVLHQRAEMIAHHAAYFSLFEMAEHARAREHVDRALEISQQLGARRFEAEALAFRATLHCSDGRRGEAQADAAEAVRIGRESGMSYLGPMLLGILALATEDDTLRRKALDEGEALLSAGSISHNHLFFRRHAIETCLNIGAWNEAERHAIAITQFACHEPMPWTDFICARGRALAAFGRGQRNAELLARLKSLKDEGDRLGLALAQLAIESALAEPRRNDPL